MASTVGNVVLVIERVLQFVSVSSSALQLENGPVNALSCVQSQAFLIETISEGILGHQLSQVSFIAS